MGMNTMGKLKLEIIDHRTWNPRGINTTLVNEIYAKDFIVVTEDDEQSLNDRLLEIQKALLETIKQPDKAKVKVHRWFPGVIEEIVEEVIETEEDGIIVTKTQRKVNLKQEIASEAATLLEKKKEMQLKATKERDVKDILGENTNGKDGTDENKTTTTTSTTVVQSELGSLPTTRRKRVKTRSTPVIGGDLFASQPATMTSSFTKSKAPMPSIDEDQNVEVKLPSTIISPSTTATPAQQTRKVRIKSKSTNAIGGGLFGDESKSSSPAIGGGEMSLNLEGPLFKYSKQSVPARDVEAQLPVDGKNYKIVLNRTALSRIIRDTETVQRLGAERPARLSTKDLRYRGAREEVPLDTVLEGIVRRDTRDLI